MAWFSPVKFGLQLLAFSPSSEQAEGFWGNQCLNSRIFRNEIKANVTDDCTILRQ